MHWGNYLIGSYLGSSFSDGLGGEASWLPSRRGGVAAPPSEQRPDGSWTSSLRMVERDTTVAHEVYTPLQHLTLGWCIPVESQMHSSAVPLAVPIEKSIQVYPRVWIYLFLYGLA